MKIEEFLTARYAEQPDDMRRPVMLALLAHHRMIREVWTEEIGPTDEPYLVEPGEGCMRCGDLGGGDVIGDSPCETLLIMAGEFERHPDFEGAWRLDRQGPAAGGARRLEYDGSVNEYVLRLDSAGLNTVRWSIMKARESMEYPGLHDGLMAESYQGVRKLQDEVEGDLKACWEGRRGRA
jgi:hypothetical protein